MQYHANILRIWEGLGGLCRDVNHFLLGEIERKINRIKIYFNFCQWGMLEEGKIF